MKEMGKRLKGLRESMGLSQMKMAEILGLKQPSINRYEQGTATPTVENLRKYADYFDVSMDYIFARTDNPEGRLYAHQPKALAGNKEVQQFIELCFDPGSPYNERLKETMLRKPCHAGGKAGVSSGGYSLGCAPIGLFLKPSALLADIYFNLSQFLKFVAKLGLLLLV